MTSGNTEKAGGRFSAAREGALRALPIVLSYFFVSTAYGMLMTQHGYAWLETLLSSAFLYTGAFQFALITFLSAGASVVTIALCAFLMNSRQCFYSLSFLNDFNAMGRRKLYMIHSMTDETYAVNTSLEEMPEKQRHDVMFYVALFSHLGWIGGSLVGAVLGQLIPALPDGVDFCMTALFVVIFTDQWEHAASHKPALVGAACAVAALYIFGAQNFMLPALLCVCGILSAMQAGRRAEE